MLECADLDAARAVLAALPFTEAGLVAYDVMALRPFTPVLGALLAPSPS